MQFETNINKIGKGKNVNCLASGSDLIVYYFSGSGVRKKTVDISTRNVNVSLVENDCYATEVLPISNNKKVKRIENSIFM